MSKDLTFKILVLIQLFLIIGSVPANSHLVSEYNFTEKSIITEKKSRDIIGKGLGFLISLISIKQIGTVSAQANWCCVDSGSNGPTCQDVSSESNSCSNPSPTSCGQTAECKIGTCIDREDGICTANSPKKTCEDSELRWEPRTINQIQECRQGCCVLGSNVNFVTEKQCQVLSNSAGINDLDFRTGLTEQECLDITLTMSTGACVVSEGDCRMVKGVECQNIRGEFYENVLCTNPDLETICKPTEETSCSTESGNYDVYFKDSCGNLANVYDFDKTFDKSPEYWNNIIEPVCNEDNPEKCGICNYPVESRCIEARENENPSLGNFICRDLKCWDEDNSEVRLNGESWCVYESRVGEGKDVVGSDHWLKYCENGDIKVDNTQQKYRGEVCAEKKIPLSSPLEGKETFSVAQYRPNFWPQCFSINIEEESDDSTTESRNAERCEANPDCRVLNIDVDRYFKFRICVPEYPKGFDIGPGAENAEESEICSFASQTCTVIEEKVYDGLDSLDDIFDINDWDVHTRWECKENCDCQKNDFAENMNKFCTALGDCGGKVNVAGDYERNYRVGGSQGISVNNPDLSTSYQGNENPNSRDKSPLYIFNADSAGSYEDIATEVSGPEIDANWWSENALLALTAGYFLSSYLYSSSIYGTTTATSTISVGTGESLTLTQTAANSGFSAWASTIGFYIVVAIIVYAVYIQATGLGEIREREVSFTCELWQPPYGEDNKCELCNDGDFPCTQYKCDSLGSGCELINKDTEEPLCVYQYSGDVNPSSLSLKKIEVDGVEIDESYIKNNEQNGFEVGESYCMGSYSEVEIVLETKDENGDGDYSRCMYDYSPVDPVGLENIGDSYSLGDSAYYTNHTFNEIVSTSHPGSYDLVQSETETKSKLDMYVRCQDPAGNYNNAEYKISFQCITTKDVTAPRITRFFPLNPWYLKFESTTSLLQLNLNEIAQCKYEFTSGVNYSAMTHDFNCNPSDEDGLKGVCSANIEGLNKDTNEIYIKCSDTNGNTNVQDVKYTFYSTKTPLKIDSIEPQGEIIGKDAYFELNLNVITSGGSAKGNSECEYSFESHPQYSSNIFAQTGASQHKQVFSSLPSGNYDLKVICSDLAGNEISSHSVFELEVDTFAPKVVRAFNENNKLKLITDEDAKCYYSNDKVKECGFDLENSTDMSSGFMKDHSADWDRGKTYFVKCVDLFENKNPGCAIRVNPA